MSKIDEQIKKLREQEKRLELEKLKVEFLTHILSSVKDYKEEAFASVKSDVIEVLEPFIKKSIEAIETGNTLEIVLRSNANPAPVIPIPLEAANATPPSKPKNAEDSVGPNDKLSFALDNRHLAGKNVNVANDQSIIIRGKVVGLDAPYVLVQTETGPTIKVPRDKIGIE